MKTNRKEFIAGIGAALLASSAVAKEDDAKAYDEWSKIKPTLTWMIYGYLTSNVYDYPKYDLKKFKQDIFCMVRAVSSHDRFHYEDGDCIKNFNVEVVELNDKPKYLGLTAKVDVELPSGRKESFSVGCALLKELYDA